MWKAILAWCGLLVVVFAVGIFAVFGTAISSVITAPARVITQTMTTGNIIFNYEQFKNLYNDFQAQQIRVKNAQSELDTFMATAGDRTTWTFEDKQQYGMLASVVSGSKNNLASIAADYNAKSSMLNRSVFKDHSLPDQLPVE